MRFSSSWRAEQKAIFGRPLDRIAESAHATRNDRNLVNRIDARKGRGDQRVAHLMIGDAAAFRRAKNAALLLEPGDDALDRGGKIVERHRLGVAPRRNDGRLVDQIGEIGAGETRRQTGDLVEIDVFGKAHLGDMHLRISSRPRAIRAIDQHLTVEAPRPQQGRIKHFRAIGGAIRITPVLGSKPSSSASS